MRKPQSFISPDPQRKGSTILRAPYTGQSPPDMLRSQNLHDKELISPVRKSTFVNTMLRSNIPSISQESQKEQTSPTKLKRTELSLRKEEKSLTEMKKIPMMYFTVLQAAKSTTKLFQTEKIDLKFDQSSDSLESTPLSLKRSHSFIADLASPAGRTPNRKGSQPSQFTTPDSSPISPNPSSRFRNNLGGGTHTLASAFSDEVQKYESSFTNKLSQYQTQQQSQQQKQQSPSEKANPKMKNKFKNYLKQESHSSDKIRSGQGGQSLITQKSQNNLIQSSRNTSLNNYFSLGREPLATNLSNFSTAEKSLLSKNAQNTYLRLIDKKPNLSDQILSELQTERRDQAIILNANQIIINPMNPPSHQKYSLLRLFDSARNTDGFEKTKKKKKKPFSVYERNPFAFQSTLNSINNSRKSTLGSIEKEQKPISPFTITNSSQQSQNLAEGRSNSKDEQKQHFMMKRSPQLSRSISSVPLIIIPNTQNNSHSQKQSRQASPRAAQLSISRLSIINSIQESSFKQQQLKIHTMAASRSPSIKKHNTISSLIYSHFQIPSDSPAKKTLPDIKNIKK